MEINIKVRVKKSLFNLFINQLKFKTGFFEFIR